MQTLQQTLYHLGIYPRYRGYRQVILAVKLLCQDEDRLYQLMSLYREIAVLSHTRASTVERNIRTLSERAWQTNPSYLMRLAGYPLDRRLTNSDFLAVLLAVVQRSEESAKI